MIDRTTRIPLFVVFSIVSAAGLLVFIFIIWRTYIEKRRENPSNSDQPKKSISADIRETLVVAVKLLKTRNMLLLLIPFAYSGISNTFFQGVYGTCIGHYVKYGGKKKHKIFERKCCFF